MSTLEARIAEVLAVHAAKRPWSDAGVMRCSCTERFVAEYVHQLDALHRTHLAAALAPVIAEAQAEALREAAGAYGPAQISGFFPGRDGYTKAWLNHRADQLEGS